MWAPRKPLSHTNSRLVQREVTDPDWFQKNSTHFYIITSAILFTILFICIYLLRRGPHRTKFPCFPNCRSSSSLPDNTHSLFPLSPTDEEKHSPPPQSTDWADASRRSRLHLADLERTWTAEGEQRGGDEIAPASRKIRKPPPKSPKSPMLPSSAHTFGHGRSPTKIAHAVSVAPTTSSFGHNPDHQYLPHVEPVPKAYQTPDQQSRPYILDVHPPYRNLYTPHTAVTTLTPGSIIAFTAVYPQLTPVYPQSIHSQPSYGASSLAPSTLYSPKSAYPLTPLTAHLSAPPPPRPHSSRDTFGAIPKPADGGVYTSNGLPVRQNASPAQSKRMSYVEYIAATLAYDSPIDFSSPSWHTYDASPRCQTAYSTESAYSQSIITPLAPSRQTYVQPGQSGSRASALPYLLAGSPCTPNPNLLISPPTAPSDRSSDSPPQSILRRSADSTPILPHSRRSSTTLTVDPSPAGVDLPVISVTAPALARVKRASYAASRMSVRSSRAPPSPLRQIAGRS